MSEAQLAASPGESFRPVAGAVVGHDALDRDAEAFVVGDRRLEEATPFRLADGILRIGIQNIAVGGGRRARVIGWASDHLTKTRNTGTQKIIVAL